MRFKKIIFAILVLIIGVAAVSCGKKAQDNSDSDNSKSEAVIYELNYAELEMVVGEKQTLQITPVSDRTIVWSSENSGIASVSAGEISALAFGETTIGAEVDGQTLTCKVKVFDKEQAKAYLTIGLDREKDTNIFVGSKYSVSVDLYSGAEKQEIINDRMDLFTSDESVLQLEKGVNGTFEMLGLKTGVAEIRASYEYGTERIYSETHTIFVNVDKTFLCNAEQIELFMPKYLSGAVTEESKVCKEINSIEFSYYSQILNQTTAIDNDEITFEVADTDIAYIENGKIVSKSCGATTLKATSRIGEIEIPVSVYYPISSAEDLDILAMSTYTKTVEEAKEYLSGWYKFTNDIDYSTHTRNFILPIASITPIYTVDLWGKYTRELFYSGYSNATSSFYSLGWKDILSLEEATAENGGKYLKNADGTEFRGINPNNLHFTGKINGNGYAIKNAWYMYDNYLGTSYGATLGFVGVNDGIIENLEANVTVPNWFTSYSGGRYYREDWPYYERENCFAKRYHDAGTILKADGNTMTTNYGEWSDATERGGFVVINALGTVQNVKYNVLYRGRGITAWNIDDGSTRIEVPTSLVCVNSSLIKNCIVAVTLEAEYSGTNHLNAPTIARANIDLGNLPITVDGDQKWLTCGNGRIENVYSTYTDLNNLGVAQTVFDSSKYGKADEKSAVVYADAAAVKEALTGFDETIWDLGDGSALPTLKRL